MPEFLSSYAFWIHVIAVLGIANTWKLHKVKKARSQRLEKWKQNNLADYSNQSRFLEKATLSCEPLMNKSEYHVFKILEPWIAEQTRFRLFAQVSLGEVFRTKDNNAFASINSKRVDFLIIDWNGYPALGIEVQGAGHGQGNADERDCVKRQIFKKANVPLLEIECKKLSDINKEQVISMLNAHLKARP